MKAIVYSQYGDADVLHLGEIDRPTPGDDEILINDHGRYLMGNPRLSGMLRSVVTSRLTSKTVLFAFARETQEELEALKTMIEAGQIRPVVDKVYTMQQAAEAHRRVETETRQGIVVISISPA